MSRSSTSVVVVGAGIAGLSTAYHLLEAGFTKVIVLEASDRHGGRILSVIPKEGEGAIELGGTCIHGASVENPVFRLATEWGMADSLSLSDRICGQFREENGEIIDEELVRQVWELFLKMEASMDKIYTERKHSKDFPSSKTFKEYAEETRPQILQEFPEEKERERADKVFNVILNYCRFMNGDELDKVSADFIGQYKSFPGPEMTFMGKGYTGFVDKLADKLPGDIIRYNTEVTKILWEKSTVEVRCKNGQTYTADHVVITCPLGHLKANYKNMFEPELPESKAGAIERTGFGRVAKLFVYYDQPFWKEGIKLAWSEQGQPNTEKSDWTKQLVFFEMLPANPKALGGPFAGRGAEIMESLSEEEVASACTELLRKFFNDPHIPKPTKLLRSNWISNPLFRGGYTYLSTENRSDDMQHLAAPLPDQRRPKVLFAGEATHPDYYSTVHGAYLSGARESQRLIELYEQ
ncbi:peroxisomal N(1)-acetyl-spermine/spermidine oxidase-like isoform X2 [Littorina saxatilis]|uniref:Amine oxidase n=2 Tax=Littorina saxatilis TaxID=31220 RepID=A0AAN9GJH6_9CAEN